MKSRRARLTRNFVCARLKSNFDYRRVRLSACPIIGVSDYRRVRLSACPIIGVSDYRRVRLSACPIIGVGFRPPVPADNRKSTVLALLYYIITSNA